MPPDAPHPPAWRRRHGGGLFSGLFGVGGGIVIVPLLVLWLGYGEREATGTSLVAIGVIAAAGAAVAGAYGNLHVEEGLLVGLPALGGVLGGTALQQRVPQERLSLLFAAVLVAVAIDSGLTDGDALVAIVLGLAAGVVAGLLGVGGGILFVPALTLALGLDHLDAEATSLLAIIPVACSAPTASTATATSGCGTAPRRRCSRSAASRSGWCWPTPCPSAPSRSASRCLMLFVAARLARKGLRRRPA